jgi:hypothetical protein
LAPDQGISHDVFKEHSQAAEPEGGEGEPETKKEEDILETF